MQDVFIVSAARTPIGKFGGAFKDLSAVDLGAHAIRAALDRAALTGADLDVYVMGNVLRAGLGQLVARQAALQAGVPETVDGFSVDMVCSSGMMAVMNAAALIRSGDAEIALAGGTESMSNAGFVLSSGARWGYKYLATAGAEPLRDVMQRDGLSDPFTGEAMGDQAERLAAEFGITRDDLDGIAAESHRRAAAAQPGTGQSGAGQSGAGQSGTGQSGAGQSGAFAREIAPVDVTTRKGTTTVSADEGVRADTTTETLRSLRPAFSKTGVLTAGSASQISDGAAALVLASEAAVKARGLTPLARIVGSAWSAGAPWRFPEAPIPAARKVFDKTGLSVGDVDLFENNEAFALNTLLFTQMLGVGRDVLNVHGGAIALGHPIGASGARILTTLTHALHTHGTSRCLAAICHGTGGGTAMIVERV